MSDGQNMDKVIGQIRRTAASVIKPSRLLSQPKRIAPDTRYYNRQLRRMRRQLRIRG